MKPIFAQPEASPQHAMLKFRQIYRDFHVLFKRNKLEKKQNFRIKVKFCYTERITHRQWFIREHMDNGFLSQRSSNMFKKISINYIIFHQWKGIVAIQDNDKTNLIYSTICDVFYYEGCQNSTEGYSIFE